MLAIKIRKNADLAAMLQAAKQCRHDVIFLSNDNDRLNLKSQLCGYVFLVLARHPELLESGEVLLKQEDWDLMCSYLE